MYICIRHRQTISSSLGTYAPIRPPSQTHYNRYNRYCNYCCTCCGPAHLSAEGYRDITSSRSP